MGFLVISYSFRNIFVVVFVVVVLLFSLFLTLEADWAFRSSRVLWFSKKRQMDQLYSIQSGRKTEKPEKHTHSFASLTISPTVYVFLFVCVLLSLFYFFIIWPTKPTFNPWFPSITSTLRLLLPFLLLFLLLLFCSCWGGVWVS